MAARRCGKFHDSLVIKIRAGHVDQFRGLLLDGRDHSRMAVPGGDHGDARGKIQKTLPSTSSTIAPRPVWPPADSRAYRRAKRTASLARSRSSPWDRAAAWSAPAVWRRWQWFVRICSRGPPAGAALASHPSGAEGAGRSRAKRKNRANERDHSLIYAQSGGASRKGKEELVSRLTARGAQSP